MIATTPLEIDGQTYDRWSLNLAITGKYKADGSPDASIAMRLIPTRIVAAAEDTAASVEQANAAAIGLLRGHLHEVQDPAEIACVTAITNALQTLVASKGL
jgi:hypothetical protein